MKPAVVEFNLQTASLKLQSMLTGDAVILDKSTSLKKNCPIWRYFPSTKDIRAVRALNNFSGASITIKSDESGADAFYLTWYMKKSDDVQAHLMSAKQIGSVDLSENGQGINLEEQLHYFREGDRKHVYGVGPSFSISTNDKHEKLPKLSSIQSRHSGVVGIWKVVYDNGPLL